MKITHITTTTRNGAGRAAMRLHESLLALGHASKMLTLERSQPKPETEVFVDRKGIGARIADKIHSELWQREYQSYVPSMPRGAGAFSDDRTVYNLAEHPFLTGADVINLHWTARFVNPATFFPAMAGRRIVWTFHDMNPFTGGCHYSQGCRRYEDACGKCPQLGTYDSSDLSHRIWKRKKLAYKAAKFVIVSPSRWLAEIAGKSSIIKGRRIEVIPYGLPTDVFTRRDRDASRNLVGVPLDKPVVLLWIDAQTERRGGRLLVDTLLHLEKRVGPQAAILLTIGSRTREIVGRTGFAVKDMGHISDDLLLASCFSASDMLIVPSWEDNLPNIILEASSCGTPVAAFRSGGIPEIVDDGRTGFLVEPKDSKALAEAAARMLADESIRARMSVEARKKAEGAYRLETQASRYVELYESL